MSKTINTTVEILGKMYPIRCPEAELSSLHQAAEFLSQKMAEVQESGKAINLERIAIITALNIAYQLLKESDLKNKIYQQIEQLQTKLDHAMQQTRQTELIYSFNET